MSVDRPSEKLGAREALDVVNQVFPNIGRFLRVVLKNEQLSQEAESLRIRFDALLGKLERMSKPMETTPSTRPASFSGSKLYHLQKMHTRHGTFSELQKDRKSCSGDLLEKDNAPHKHNGHLLCKEPAKCRWHRYSCYVSSLDAQLYLYDPSDNSSLVTTIPLDGKAIASGEEIDQQTEKENSFVITRINDGVHEYHLAAYSQEDFKTWMDVLTKVIENISLKAKRNSMPCFSNHPSDKPGVWTVVPPFDISSNGESSRDSAISSGSSNHRISWAFNGSSSPFRARKGFDLDLEEPLTNGRAPKPLPSPPVYHLGVSKSGDGDDITIYEDIEELQELVDKQLKQTHATISQMGKNKDYHRSGKSGKKRKKKDLTLDTQRSGSSIVSLPFRDIMTTKSFSSSAIVTQTSTRKTTTTMTTTSSSSRLPHLDRNNVLNRNTSIYSSFLHMRAMNTNWERKWFTLQKSVLTYTRNQEDKDGHVKVLVGCKVESFKDSKRKFAMRISQPKELDMYLSAEDEIQFIEWLTRLQMATKVQTDLDGMEEFDGSTWNMADLRDSMVTNDSGTTSTSGSCRTSIISVDFTKRMLPRPPTAEGAREVTALIPTEDNPTDSAFLSDLTGEGIYDVPRSVIAPYGGKIVVGGIQDLYDHPRKIMMRDEGVYNSPDEQNEDEDIYVYPPDAIDDHTMLTQEQALQSLADYDYPKLARGSMVSSSASTYRDSSMSDSTLRDSHASYVTINAEEGQSIPPMLNGGLPYNYVNGEVKFSAGELSELMDPTSRASQAISEGLYDRPKSLWSTVDEIEPMQMETMSGGIKGYLFRKEKRSWTKMLCCIQNNRFECFKSNTLALKLFLPGAEILPDPDAKRPYAFKIKHPRKEAILQFAAEGEMQYRMWLSAFIKAASISVQPVNDVEQIRVVDVSMKEKWKNLEVTRPAEKNIVPPSKRKLIKTSTVDSNIDGVDDTLQRKKKLFTKGMFSGRKKKKSSVDQARGETTSPISPKPAHSNENILSADENETSIKRSHSLDTLISSRSPITSPIRQLSKLQQQHQLQQQQLVSVTNNKPLQIPLTNAGYLLVQRTRMQGDSAWVRYWSVYENLVINFFPAVMEAGSHFKIGLQGSRVSRAVQETTRPLSFMIWHLESGSRIFCVTESELEFISWFEILTNGAEHVVPSNPDNLRRSTSFYYFDSDHKLPNNREADISEQFDGSEQTLTFSRDHLYTQSSLNSSQENMLQDSDYFLGSAGSLSSAGSPVQHAGILKLKTAPDKWVDRYSMVRKSTLYMYKNPHEKTPVSAVVLPRCQVAKVEDPDEPFVFTVLEFEGKTPHSLATQSATELMQWLRIIQECSDENVSASDLHQMKQWLSNEDITLDDEKRKQYRSAEDLPTINDDDGDTDFKAMSVRKTKAMTIDSRPRRSKSQSSDTQSGFVEVLFKSSSWTIYWCTIKDRCFYMYQSPESNLPLKSIALARYGIQADNTHTRKPHCLVLTRTSSFPIYISLSDSLEKQSWLKALQKASRVEVVPANAEKESLSSFESGSVMMGDSQASALDQLGSSVESADNSLERKKHAVLKQYERNMKKTHKFSKQTTDSLKREKRGLVAMKKQIAPHLERLKTLADNGDERAQEKFVALQIKIKQIDAVLPYLEKCISKNKEAEQKTIAILEKKRDEELIALEEGTADVTTSTDKMEVDTHTSTSDLYMKVLSDSHKLEDSSRVNGIFRDGELAKTAEIIDYSTPQHYPEFNIMAGSTPHVTATGSILMDTLLTPITPVHNTSVHEQSSGVLDDTITSVPVEHDHSMHIAPIEAYSTPVVSSRSSHNFQLNNGVPPVTTIQGEAVLPMGTNTIEPTTHIVPENGVQLPNGTPMGSGTLQYTSQLSTSSEPPPPAAAVAAMSQPRHSIGDWSNKPPPIRPKKKKVPPPRPPRRSSCDATTANMIYLEDSPASGNRHQSADANIPPTVPTKSSANVNKRTSDLLGSDLDKVSVFSKIKAFEKA